MMYYWDISKVSTVVLLINEAVIGGKTEELK